MNATLSPVPPGLNAAGTKLWRSVTDDHELNAPDELLLLQAARTADRLDDLATALADAPLTTTNGRGDVIAQPLLVEQRQQSIVLSRLIASLRLPDEDDGSGEVRRPQRRGGARGSYKPRLVV